MTEPIPNNASFDPSDVPYLCPNCNKVLLRYNAGISRPVQVTGGDSSLASIITWEHVCPNITGNTKIKDSVIGLSSQQREKELQQEVYQGFFSTAQLKPVGTWKKATGRPKGLE